jgi:hypothetical protein
VQYIYKVTALLILALWLLATQHSALEMAGLLPDHAAEVSHLHDSNGNESEVPIPHGAVHDWHFMEKTVGKPSSNLLKVPAPVLLLAVSFLCLQLFATASAREPSLTAIARVALERPMAWVPKWHFVRRAAPPARAPALST